MNGDINQIISRRPAKQAVEVIVRREFPAVLKETAFNWKSEHTHSVSDQTHTCIRVTHFSEALYL